TTRSPLMRTLPPHPLPSLPPPHPPSHTPLPPPPRPPLFPYTTLFRSLAGQAAEQLQQLLPAERVDPAQGFVEDEQLRVVEQGLRSEEHTSELQSRSELVCRLLLEKKKTDETRTRRFMAFPVFLRAWTC